MIMITADAFVFYHDWYWLNQICKMLNSVKTSVVNFFLQVLL